MTIHINLICILQLCSIVITIFRRASSSRHFGSIRNHNILPCIIFHSSRGKCNLKAICRNIFTLGSNPIYRFIHSNAFAGQCSIPIILQVVRRIRYFKGAKFRNVHRNTYRNRIRNMVAYAVICIFCFGIVFSNYFLFQVRLFIDNFNGNICLRFLTIRNIAIAANYKHNRSLIKNITIIRIIALFDKTVGTLRQTTYSNLAISRL